MKQIVGVCSIAAALAFVAVFGLLVYVRLTLPTINSIADYSPKRATSIYSDDGFLVGQLYIERRTVVPIQLLPKHLVYAFLAAEDAGFYQHEGLDYLGILRAAIKNLRPGAHLQGASTITQQTVKTLVVGAERSYIRKMREALLSRQLEQVLSKDDILHIYLNQIYFGEGAYGVEEASRTYFNKSARDLDLGEAAFLAAIPKNPSHYTITADPAAAKSRQKYVLEQMKTSGWAAPEDVAKAIAAPIPAPAAGAEYLGRAPHYVEHVRRALIEMYGEDMTQGAGLTVYTGMSAPMQRAAHQIIRGGLEDVARRQGYAGAPLRIEVDRLTRYRDALHKEFVQRTTGIHNARNQLSIWDLGGINAERLKDEATVGQAMRLTVLDQGERTTGLVVQVASADDEIWVDLGSLQGHIPLRNLDWARRFSPEAATPAPRNVGEVLHAGDLVFVEIARVLVDPARPSAMPRVELNLVPVPTVNGALVAIDPSTRLVKAMVGGYDLNPAAFNRATQALRQPGSAFKPVVYATGLLNRVLTPATICPDTPILIRDQWTGKAWKPENYEDGRYDGNITYRNALKLSKNTCSVKLIEKLGPEPVIALAQKMGIHTPLPANLTLALGSGDVKPIELANAYTTIAAGGMYAEPIFIRKVVDSQGTTLFEARSEPEEVLPSNVAFVLTDMMRAVVEEGTAIRARILDRPLAGKTGTSNESRNVWFSGFSPELVATVWVGFDDNRSMGRETGASAALPIWVAFVADALEHSPRHEFLPPADVVFVGIDPKTGLLSSAPGNIEQAFIAGTEPKETTQVLPSIFFQDDETLRGKP